MARCELAAIFTMTLLVASCARNPRTPPTAEQNSRPQTRSAVTASPRPPANVRGTANEPSCTLALQLTDTLLDCTFDHCPPELLSQLLGLDDIAVEEGTDGQLGIVAHRPQPPRAVRLATFLQGPSGWNIQPDLDESVGHCSGLSKDSLEGPVSGVSVRRQMAKRPVVSRP